MEISDTYPEEHLQGLYNMREHDQLCDVTIHVGGRKFRAHKTVLAATGHYFLTMFTSGFRESSAQEVTIEGSPAAFEILLNFVYTSKVDGTKVASCMIEVLEMACYMQFTEFVNICSTAVQKILEVTAVTEAFSLSDVCKVMLLAKTHDLTAVYQATLRYLEDKVESLKCLDVFLENVNAPILEDFLCQENLSNADEEEHVLELVINWLKHDWENSRGHSHQLLQKVRLGLVASEDIKKLIGPEILDIPGCSELVNRALDLHASKRPKEILAIENPDIAAPRSTIMAPVTLNHGKMKYYDVKQKEWITMNKMDPLPSGSESNIYELIVVKGVLYAAGGNYGKEFLRYQASENRWIPLPSKPRYKERFKLVALGAYIYAFGACCAPKGQVIERYDIGAEKWEMLQLRNSFGLGRYTMLAEVVDEDGITCTGLCGCSMTEEVEDKKRRELFAVAFEGKIILSSLKQEVDYDSCQRDGDWSPSWREPELLHELEGELVIFDPVMNTYKMKDVGWAPEDDYGDWDSSCFKPTLFVHEDHLHLMRTEFIGRHSPVKVNRLHVTQKDGKTALKHSDLVREAVGYLHYSPDHEDAPFYLQDKIFIKDSGSSNAGHSKVKSFPRYGENKQLMYVSESDLIYPVWFSFERKLTVTNRKWP